MRIITSGAGILGAILFVIASILGGIQIEEYSFIRQYISESYADGLPNTAYLRYMYMASGALIALFGFTAPAMMPKSKGITIGFFLFAIFYGLATMATGFFPCEIGCPQGSEITGSQFIHNTIGFITYMIVPFCLLLVGLAAKRIDKTVFSRVSVSGGILTFIFVFILFSSPNGPYAGLFQRSIESSILFWMIFSAFNLKNR